MPRDSARGAQHMPQLTLSILHPMAATTAFHRLTDPSKRENERTEPQIRRKVTKIRVQAFREAVADTGNRCVLTPTFYVRQSAE